MKREYQKDILKAILRNYPKDLSISDINDETGFARDTISKYLGKLKTKGFVEKSRKVGKTRMYTVGPRLEMLIESSDEGGEEIYDVLELA